MIILKLDIFSSFGTILKCNSISVSCLFFLFSFHTSYSQTTIYGIIVDENNAPIPFAHLHIENTNLGTVSNENGQFRLKCDHEIEKRPVIISAIGYQTRRVPLKEGNQTITLVSEITQLKGVTLVPIDYGRELIHKAIKAIPSNYPKVEERHTGFLRETTRWKENKTPLYIAEAVIESVKKPYSKKHLSGDVKLDEFRKYESGQLDSLYVRIYGGSHDIHSFDVVARRAAFLGRPKSYKYKIEDTLRQKNKDIYKIYFKNKGGISGNVYVMDASFAIIKVEIRDTSFTSLLNIGPYRRKYTDLTINYEEGEDQLWRYKHSHYETAFDRIENVLELKSDYVTTKVKPNTLNIPYIERFQYQDILLDAPKPYNPDFWNNYNIILPDQKTEGLFKSMNYLKKKNNKKSKNKLFDFLLRIEHDISVMGTWINMKSNTTTFNTPGLVLKENLTPSKQFVLGLSYSLIYEVRSNLFLGYTSESKISKTGMTSHDLGISKKFNVNPNGRPIFISPNINFGYQKLDLLIGSYSHTADLIINGKSFNGNEVDIFLSQKNLRLQPNISFSLEKSRRIQFKISIGHNFQFNGMKGLFLSEKDGFFAFRKKTFLRSGKENLSINHGDGDLLQNNLNIKAGFVLGF